MDKRKRKPAGWKQLQYIQHWSRENQKSINFRLNRKTEADLVEVFESIPNKAEWFKECLRSYAGK